MRETESTAFQNLTDHRKYIIRRNRLILEAWRYEHHTWVEIAERVGMSLRQVQRAAQRANGGNWPERNT